jgi:nitroimidazol reductase NimA-like FMN-containing flavoprotein (pyridoxamine 5'-phosphate oxidase superfamily)
MTCSPIYYFSAPKGEYLELATSSHPIKAERYEIHLDFISLVRELNFAGGSDENLYMHL